jgi:hypothetical protein
MNAQNFASNLLRTDVNAIRNIANILQRKRTAIIYGPHPQYTPMAELLFFQIFHFRVRERGKID